MTLSKLSGPKLEALVAKRGDAVAVANREAIAAGLGNVRFNDLGKHLESDDVRVHRAARASIDTAQAFHDANDELAQRKRYHGGTQPIRGQAR